MIPLTFKSYTHIYIYIYTISFETNKKTAKEHKEHLESLKQQQKLVERDVLRFQEREKCLARVGNKCLTRKNLWHHASSLCRSFLNFSSLSSCMPLASCAGVEEAMA